MAGTLNPNIRLALWTNFTGWCHQAVILGYNEIIKNPLPYKEWEEEDISAALFCALEGLSLVEEKRIVIVPEYTRYTEEIATGKRKAKTADRIDFMFSNWSQEKQMKYFGEAKNVSLKNWTKAIGTTVNASSYRARYIKTGIDRLVFGKYSVIDGFLIGYLVNGVTKDNILAINSLITRRGLPPVIGLIDNQKAICGHFDCYTSTNLKGADKMILQHIFLEFDTVQPT